MPRDVVTSIVRANEMQMVAKIRMVSGIEHCCSAILMFDIGLIRAAEQLRQKVERSFGGFQTGLGFLGSFPYVVSGALALGLVENLVSQKMTKQGLNLLEEYNQACIRLRNSGTFIELHQIEGIRVPIPQSWRVITGRDADGATGYLLYNDPCVAIRSAVGVTSIMWDKVEDYAIEETL